MADDDIPTIPLDDRFIKDLLTLKKALGRWQGGVEAYTSGPITIPLDAEPVVQDRAARVGIPVTSKGICFIISCQGDLDKALVQVMDLQAELGPVASILMDGARPSSIQKRRWWQFWKV